MGRLLIEQRPDGSEVAYTYGELNANVYAISGANRYAYSLTRDAAGRITQRVENVDGAAITWAYSYDSLGRLVEVKKNGVIAESYSYDANGNRLTANAVSCSYNAEDHIVSAGADSYQFNTDGFLTRKTTATGITQYEYSSRGEMLSVTKPDGTIIAYENDPLGRRIAKKINGNVTEKYLWQDMTRLLAVYDADGLLTSAGGFTITRNAQNGLPEAVNGGIFANTRGFNTYGELNTNVYAISGANRYSYNLTRDAAGRITQRVENVDGAAITWAYSYDSLGRLVEVKKNGVIAENYSYDANGNRLTANAVSFSYNAEDHIVSAGADSYQFNADGFLTRKTTATGITQYEYSSRGEMLSVTKPDGTIIAYENDPLGRRIAKKINGNVTEKYLWQDMTRLLAVYDASNNLVMRFTYADSRLPVSMTSAGATSYLMYDQVGTLRAITDNTGNIIKRIDYDSFGNILSDTNPAMSVPFGFAGGLHDQDTGLVRFGYRDYAPEIARWTAKDPIDFAGRDLNLYGYVGMDPVNWVDAEGLATLFFDSNRDSLLIVPHRNGTTPYFIPATSGNADIDPLPSGAYTIDTANLSNPGFLYDLLRQFIGDWGDWRVPLMPLFDTNRSGFFIHGGSRPGSNGCIDIGGGILGNENTDRLLNDLLNEPDSTLIVFWCNSGDSISISIRLLT